MNPTLISREKAPMVEVRIPTTEERGAVVAGIPVDTDAFARRQRYGMLGAHSVRHTGQAGSDVNSYQIVGPEVMLPGAGARH